MQGLAQHKFTPTSSQATLKGFLENKMKKDYELLAELYFVPFMIALLFYGFHAQWSHLIILFASMFSISMSMRIIIKKELLEDGIELVKDDDID